MKNSKTIAVAIQLITKNSKIKATRGCIINLTLNKIPFKTIQHSRKKP